jgi:hypothetical protein
MTDEARSLEQRKADTLAILGAAEADVWVASAGADGPYLVPLSLGWIEERIVLALSGSSRTARNLLERGAARLGAGHTREVVMIDAVLERSMPVAEAERSPTGTRRRPTGIREKPVAITSTWCCARTGSRHGARPTRSPAAS